MAPDSGTSIPADLIGSDLHRVGKNDCNSFQGLAMRKARFLLEGTRGGEGVKMLSRSTLLQGLALKRSLATSSQKKKQFQGSIL